MNPGKLLVAVVAAFSLLVANSAAAAPAVQAKANSAGGTVHAAVKPTHAAKAEARGRANKRPARDAQLDHPQLG
jgi:hypothetical protein